MHARKKIKGKRKKENINQETPFWEVSHLSSNLNKGVSHEKIWGKRFQMVKTENQDLKLKQAWHFGD